MITAAMGLYFTSIVLVMFTSSIMTQNAMGVSLIHLINNGQDEWIIGAILVVVSIVGIILMLTKKRKLITVSAILAVLACVFSFAFTIINGFTIDSFSNSLMCILLPLVYLWTGIISGMYVFTSKNEN